MLTRQVVLTEVALRKIGAGGVVLSPGVDWVFEVKLVESYRSWSSWYATETWMVNVTKSA